MPQPSQLAFFRRFNTDDRMLWNVFQMHTVLTENQASSPALRHETSRMRDSDFNRLHSEKRLEKDAMVLETPTPGVRSSERVGKWR
jgi:hypothetical protein